MSSPAKEFNIFNTLYYIVFFQIKMAAKILHLVEFVVAAEKGLQVNSSYMMDWAVLNRLKNLIRSNYVDPSPLISLRTPMTFLYYKIVS